MSDLYPRAMAAAFIDGGQNRKAMKLRAGLFSAVNLVGFVKTPCHGWREVAP